MCEEMCEAPTSDKRPKMIVNQVMSYLTKGKCEKVPLAQGRVLQKETTLADLFVRAVYFARKCD